MANTHDSLDLFGRSGQQHSLRHNAEIRQPVTLVGLQFFLRSDQASVPGDDAELLEDAGVHEFLLLGLPAPFPGRGLPGRQRSASVPKRQTVQDERSKGYSVAMTTTKTASATMRKGRSFSLLLWGMFLPLLIKSAPASSTDDEIEADRSLECAARRVQRDRPGLIPDDPVHW